MNKAEFIAALSEKTGYKANKFVNAFIDTVTEALEKGDKVQILGFGTFEVKERAPKTCRNPKTGGTVSIGARNVPVFKAGKALKEAINK